MGSLRVSARAVIVVPPGPPFSQIEGSIGGGADQVNVWIVTDGTPIRLTPYTDGVSGPFGDEMKSPRLNPAGTQVAFFDTDPDDFSTSLYVVPVDGSATYPLSPSFRFWDDAGGGYRANHPGWDAAGDKIVFTTAAPDGGSYLGGTIGGRIVSATYPGGIATDLWTPNVQTPQREEGHAPQYSPDGTKILFFINVQSGGGGTLSRQGLWVMDANGSNVTQLDNWSSASADHGFLYSGTQAAWSHDSQWIAYVDRGTSGGGTWSVYKIQPDGTNKTLLANGSSGTVRHSVAHDAWLSDDSAVICTERAGVGRRAILSAAADGSGTTELVPNTDGPEGTVNFETCYLHGTRIYWVYVKNTLLLRSCALEGTDIQTYYDGATIGGQVLSGTGFEWA